MEYFLMIMLCLKWFCYTYKTHWIRKKIIGKHTGSESVTVTLMDDSYACAPCTFLFWNEYVFFKDVAHHYCQGTIYGVFSKLWFVPPRSMASSSFSCNFTTEWRHTLNAHFWSCNISTKLKDATSRWPEAIDHFLNDF